MDQRPHSFLEWCINAFKLIILKSKILDCIIQFLVLLSFSLILVFEFIHLELEVFILRLNIFQVLKLLFILSDQVSIFSFHFKFDVNDVVSSSLLLDKHILTESLNWSEWTEICGKFFTHFGLLLVEFEIVHHDFEHSLLFFVGFYFLFEFEAMGFKIFDSCFVKFKMINLRWGNLIRGKLICVNLSLDIFVSFFVPPSKLVWDFQTFQLCNKFSFLFLVLISLENHLIDEFKQGHTNVRIFKSETLEKCLESNALWLSGMRHSSSVNQVELIGHATLSNIEEDTNTLFLCELIFVSKMEELFKILLGSLRNSFDTASVAQHCSQNLAGNSNDLSVVGVLTFFNELHDLLDTLQFNECSYERFILRSQVVRNSSNFTRVKF